MSSTSEREFLLQLLDEAYDHRSWHGPNLRSSLRGVDFLAAAWRPAPERHNIWEQALHAAYWKYVARRRLTGEKRGSFALDGSNWFERNASHGAAAWKQDLLLLGQTHQALRAAVAALSPADLAKAPKGSNVSAAMLIRGVAMHDVYHAGQIQGLKRSLPRSLHR
jgi:hypothetical protein